MVEDPRLKETLMPHKGEEGISLSLSSINHVHVSYLMFHVSSINHLSCTCFMLFHVSSSNHLSSLMYLFHVSSINNLSSIMYLFHISCFMYHLSVIYHVPVSCIIYQSSIIYHVPVSCFMFQSVMYLFHVSCIIYQTSIMYMFHLSILYHAHVSCCFLYHLSNLLSICFIYQSSIIFMFHVSSILYQSLSKYIEEERKGFPSAGRDLSLSLPPTLESWLLDCTLSGRRWQTFFSHFGRPILEQSFFFSLLFFKDQDPLFMPELEKNTFQSKAFGCSQRMKKEVTFTTHLWERQSSSEMLTQSRKAFFSDIEFFSKALRSKGCVELEAEWQIRENEVEMENIPLTLRVAHAVTV